MIIFHFHISLMSAIFASILNSLINPIIYCVKIRKFRVAFIEALFRKTTIQAENTEKRMFGSSNKVAPLKAEEQQPRQQQMTANRSDTASDAATAMEAKTTPTLTTSFPGFFSYL